MSTFEIIFYTILPIWILWITGCFDIKPVEQYKNKDKNEKTNRR